MTEITDKKLDAYPKLSRHKNEWGFSFEVYDRITQFQVSKLGSDYLVYLNQGKIHKDVWMNTVLLGKLTSTEELESIFLAVTRGEFL